MIQVHSNRAAYDIVRGLFKEVKAWRHHGLGMLQGEIDDRLRIHLWEPALRTLPYNTWRDVHDHRFRIVSHVISGALTDVRYEVEICPPHSAIARTSAWEIKHAKIQSGPKHTTGREHEPESDVVYLGGAWVDEIGRTVFGAGARYEIPRRVWHTTRVDFGHAITLVERCDFDERPARILGAGKNEDLTHPDEDPARETHETLVKSVLERAWMRIEALL